MSSVQSLFESFIIMIVCLFSSVIITEFVLAPGELVENQLVSNGISDAPPEWHAMDGVDSLWSYGYFLTYFLDFYAIGQFVWTCIRKQRYDIYGNPISEGEF